MLAGGRARGRGRRRRRARGHARLPHRNAGRRARREGRHEVRRRASSRTTSTSRSSTSTSRRQADVKSLLDTLDSTVDTIFTSGEKQARENFEKYVDQKMRAYKADRYGGVFGGARWLKDKLFDLPDEVNDFYRDGRALYLEEMDHVIEAIAVVVGMLLGAAHLRIQAGREEVRAFVKSLPESRQSKADEVAADLDNRFDQLASDVDAKRDELVDTVARKYVESRDDLDSRIKELQEANKGLVSKAIDAIVGVLKTIYELTKLLLRVLLKAASAIGDIVAHPIRFLETSSTRSRAASTSSSSASRPTCRSR